MLRLLFVVRMTAACTLSRESGVDTTRVALSGASCADSSADDWQPPLIADLVKGKIKDPLFAFLEQHGWERKKGFFRRLFS